MWVYPNQVIENQNWADSPPGIGILLALGEGDRMFIYNTSATNYLHLGMPSEVVNCEVRIRGSDPNPPDYDDFPPIGIYPPLRMEFYLAGNLVDVIVLPSTNTWITHEITVDRWDSVRLIAEGETVGVDFLRAYSFGGLPTRRTLTGVGI